jgi:hypothetical protein
MHSETILGLPDYEIREIQREGGWYAFARGIRD